MTEDLFEANGWADTWRYDIYGYVHYHSRIHEVLGIAHGKGRLRFGGKTERRGQMAAASTPRAPRMLAFAIACSLTAETSIAAAFVGASLAWLVISGVAWSLRRKMRSARRVRIEQKGSGPAIQRSR